MYLYNSKKHAYLNNEKPHSHQKPRGFTLLELLITISILSILLIAALPNYQRLIMKNDADTSIQQVHNLWQYSRTEAIRSSKNLLLCGSNDGQYCARTWKNFLILFDDQNGDKQPGEHEIIYSQNIATAKGSLQTRAAFGKNYIIIDERGNAPLTGSILYCNNQQHAEMERKLTWNLAGRPYITGGHKNYTSASTIKCTL